MLSLNMGFMAMSTAHLLLIVSFLLALLWGWLVGRRQRINPESQLFRGLLIGLVAARLAFVWRYFEQYQGSFWRVLDIRDGGFMLWVGIVAGLLFIGWQGWRKMALRRPLAVAVLVGLCVWGAGSLALHGLQNRQLPTVNLHTLEGAAVELTEYRGQPLVINLWASWCPPCRQEMPVLAKAQARHPDVVFLFVDQGETAAEVRRFLHGLALPLENVLIDRHSELGKAAGSSMLPTTLFYDRSGRLRANHLGMLSDASLQHGLRLLEVKQP